MQNLGLSEQDYIKNPRIQEKFYGETAAIRPFDANDKLDIDALLKISSNPDVQKWMDMSEVQDEKGNIDQNKVLEWAKEQTGDRVLYAVSGSPIHSESKDVGEVQGFVYIYPVSQESSECFNKSGINIPNTKLSEVSFATLPGAKSRQVASATRKAIKAYAGGQGLSHHETIFISTNDPKNEKSRNVLQACGFDKVGEAYYDRDAEKQGKKDEIHKLNPNKLDQILISHLTTPGKEAS